MKRTDTTARPSFTPRFLVGALTLILLSALPRPASAQFSQIGAAVNLAAIGVLGTDVGYDPARDQYLFVGGHGPIFGICTNAIGQPTTVLFDIMNNPALFAHRPRAKYSPDAGAFFVTWHQNDGGSVNAIHGRLVSCAAGAPVSADVTISNVFEDGTAYFQIGPPTAYSSSSHVFLVVWQSSSNAIRGRFVSAGGVPLGTTMLLANPGGARDPGLVWNPATNEFGMSYTGWDGAGAFAAFRKVRVDGTLSPLQKFWYGTGTFNTDITVNTANGNYVMGYVANNAGAASQFATFDVAGNMLNSGLITRRFGNTDNFSLAFNAVSGTVLAAGSDNFTYEVAAIELSGDGVPISSAGGVTQGTNNPGSFYPRVAARTAAPQWGISFSREYNKLAAQFIVSGGAALPPPPPPPPPPTPTPTPTPTTGCSGPDPFASIGGGSCVNGGWVPGGSAPAPAPAPPAPPPPSSGGGGTGCSGSDPFVAIGGGHCVNGGWVPGPGPSTGGSPSPGGCSGADPFAAIGGGVCVNGGWQPANMTCGGTPDPFVSIGGGVCINGGWRPKGRP